MSDYLVKASALEGFRQTVSQLGGHPDDLLSRAGLAGMDSSPEAWISYTNYLHLLEASARQLNCPYFGLQLSRMQDIKSCIQDQ